MSIYTNTIPAAGNAPSADQPLMLQNFDALQDAQDRNHVSLSDTSNRGKHNFMQMPEQGSAPATSSTELALYTKSDGTDPQLFYRKKSSGTEYQLTNGLIPNILTGTWVATGSYTQVAQMVAGTYGILFFFVNSGGSTLAQNGYYYINSAKVRGYATLTDYENTTSNSRVLKFNDDPSSDGYLYARSNISAATGQTFQYRIVYWYT